MSGGKKAVNKNQAFRRQKVRDARTIRAQAVAVDGKGAGELSEGGGMLKIGEFIGSREFEIRELQAAMRSSKAANSTRVFQALPRKLRRRTASHNIRRIPKRLRNRAIREMLKSEQSTVVKKSGKHRRHGLTARQLYRAKMSTKLLRLAGKCTSMRAGLPRDITAKSCNLRQKLRALRATINSARSGAGQRELLGNKLGSYDNTGLGELASTPKGRPKYFKRQRLFTWLPSHIWNAKRSHMIKRWGFQIPWSPTQKCFKLAHRIGGNVSASDGALSMDTSFYGTLIITDTSTGESAALKELVSQMTNQRAVLSKYRISKTWFEGLLYDLEEDSSAILGEMDLLWIELNMVMIRTHPSIYSKVFKSLKSRIPNGFRIHDCRYSLGSITLKGAKSLMSLASVLRSCEKSLSYQQFSRISRVSEISSLPHRTMFAFNCMDPRHLARPRPINSSELAKAPTIEEIISLQNDFPLEAITQVLKRLCDPKNRSDSYKNQQTLKQIASRRQALLSSEPADRKQNMIPFDSKTDPAIPLLVVKRQQNKDWVLLLPWFWVLPFWCQLNRVSRVHHFGLRQQQQLNFEDGRLYFPDDFPFTKAGEMENALKGGASRSKWTRKPPAKRINFERIPGLHREPIPAIAGEIGDSFTSDWRLLQLLRNGLEYLTRQDQPLTLFHQAKTSQFAANGMREIQTVNDLFELYKDLAGIEQPQGSECLPIRLTGRREKLVERSWQEPLQLSLSQTPLDVVAISCTLLERGRPTDNARIYKIPPEDQEHWMSVKDGIYRADGRVDHDVHHPSPRVTDLIGFVTSGSFHLGLGRGVAHGFIDARNQSPRYVLVRNVGTTTYRLASWTHIDI
ncbi:hypothetical protein HG536_0D00400 [Torulaspora globosa]|uniref:Pop1 N-terminal domain-containing protein n=1 Tax=Torulaspora globosa TaxID=48254 RepID=A0A7G3ZG82_9SACH|nr:uncharacterized protein HG536_0D00400 [Torulaspora globosa]QLL32518.1 hypothetical protein HG536_0D00400 [Torulaspora globosa]